MTPAVRFVEVVPPPDWGRLPRPLTLDVPEGAFCLIESSPALFGPLLRACVGFVSPLAGKVEVLGIEPERLPRREAQQFRRRIGVGLRPGGLTSNQTMRMNVATPLLYSGMAAPEIAMRRADQVLRDCGLTRWANHRPDDTPPDVRQGVVIARAIARRPELLVLEDPLSAIDSAQVERLLSVCREAAGTILVATQQADDVLGRFPDLTVSWNIQQSDLYEVGAY